PTIIEFSGRVVFPRALFRPRFFTCPELFSQEVSMTQDISQRNCGRTFFPRLYFLIAMFSICAMVACWQTPAAAATPTVGDALYFSLMPAAALPAAPSSLIINSPTYIDVPAGAKLSVYLMRGDAVVSTSTLTFQNAYFNPQLFVPGQVASF